MCRRYLHRDRSSDSMTREKAAGSSRAGWAPARGAWPRQAVTIFLSQLDDPVRERTFVKGCAARPRGHESPIKSPSHGDDRCQARGSPGLLGLGHGSRHQAVWGPPRPRPQGFQFAQLEEFRLGSNAATIRSVLQTYVNHMIRRIVWINDMILIDT